MWGSALSLLFLFVTQRASAKFDVSCQEERGIKPPYKAPQAPSPVRNIYVSLVKKDTYYMLNISWTIDIDASTKFLQYTHIEFQSMRGLVCKYAPSFTKANLTGLEGVQFYHLMKVSYGMEAVTISNRPMPPKHGSALPFIISIPKITIAKPTTTTTTSPEITTALKMNPTKEPGNDIITGVLGFIAPVGLLCCCFIICYSFRARFISRSGFSMVPPPPVPVLLVYPPKDSVFQCAVVALAEFLQCHFSCQVAIDMWQQEKVAELGPMRWLAEQIQTSRYVLIVSSRIQTTLSHTSQSDLKLSLPEMPVPAASYDVYPLILNMVASRAKNADELANFWVLQLNERKDKAHCALAPELRACRAFYLMEDLKKLYESIHGQKIVEKRLLGLKTRPQFSCCGKTTAKLREAIERQKGKEPRIAAEMLV